MSDIIFQSNDQKHCCVIHYQKKQTHLYLAFTNSFIGDRLWLKVTVIKYCDCRTQHMLRSVLTNPRCDRCAMEKEHTLPPTSKYITGIWNESVKHVLAT